MLRNCVRVGGQVRPGQRSCMETDTPASGATRPKQVTVAACAIPGRAEHVPADRLPAEYSVRNLHIHGSQGGVFVLEMLVHVASSAERNSRPRIINAEAQPAQRV